MTDIVLDRVDECIMGVVSKSEKPLTIYKIAKESGISWATVNTHCYKLKSQGVLNDTAFESGPGRKSVFWGPAARTPTLDKFV